jgi:hypothetical protein
VIFDRFVHYEWGERALALAIKKESSRDLQSWLVEQGLGSESARRTRNVLSHLWFDFDSSTRTLRADALNLSATLEPKERLALHWGMATIQFPMFRETANAIGRLGLLQQEFNKTEIIGRVLEKHSNQTTIRRAVERVLQTMINWAVLDMTSKAIYRFGVRHSITSSALAEWLFRALMVVYPEKYWLLPDLLGAAEFFPFDLADHNVILYKSTHLTIERDSYGVEIIGMRSS